MAKKILTTNPGVLTDNLNSLTAGQHGQTLLPDVPLIEKQVKML
jgi:catalase